jgi:S1-C subfamily serine protease
MKPWHKVLIFTLLNIPCFYGLRTYYDTRQVHLVSALLPSVVKVFIVGPKYTYEPYLINDNEIGFKKIRKGFGVIGHGSGVFIDKDGLILTCNHVVADGPLAKVQLDGPEFLTQAAPKGCSVDKTVLAYVVGRDVANDVALLRLCKPLKGIRPAQVGTSVRKGLPVLTIGFPGPFHKYVTAGVVSGSRNGDIYSDLVIAPGNSGGGVFDANGRVVGLARAMTGPFPIPIYQGFSVLTALDKINDLLEKYKGF